MKKHPAKTQGKMKMTKMKSCIFSKIWKEISLKNISPRNFFFLEKIIFKKSSPDFGKPQKFHDFVFSSPEFKQKSFPPEKDSTSPGERSGEFRRIVLN